MNSNIFKNEAFHNSHKNNSPKSIPALDIICKRIMLYNGSGLEAFFSGNIIDEVSLQVKKEILSSIAGLQLTIYQPSKEK